MFPLWKSGVDEASVGGLGNSVERQRIWVIAAVIPPPIQNS